ncbi:MAG: N-acyl-D-amino-acid deacylase family protein [Acidimicrobiales bacterium]
MDAATDALAPFIVKGGTLMDGSTSPRRTDIRVDDNGRVAEIGEHLRASETEKVVDAEGLTISPGFVDLHSHSDLYTMSREGSSAPVGDAPKLLQGCTAQIFGQDGVSAAPVEDHGVDDLARSMVGLDGSIEAEQWTWRSFGEYLAAVRRKSATRTAGLVGHSTIRRMVMGLEMRPPNDSELDRMCQAVDSAMAQGALGLSTGLVYVPAAYAGTDELIALARVVASRGGRFFVHVRSESDRVVEATEEVLEVARHSGVHLHYSHIKTAGRANWPLANKLVEMVSDYQARGVQVTADIHPYVAGSTTATVLLPPWVFEGGENAARMRLSDPATRERVRSQMLSDTTSYDNWFAFSDGFEGLRIAQASRPEVQGKSFAEWIRSEGVSDINSQEAFDLLFDLLISENFSVSLISFNNTEENIARFLALPYTSVGSDALVNPHGHPHPRLYGTFPRVLRRFVRELGVLDLPTAIQAMTSKAAATAGWPGVGNIVVGGHADMVAFDPERVSDQATWEEPRLPPVGIEKVWVGGRLAVKGGRLAGQVDVAETDGP